MTYRRTYDPTNREQVASTLRKEIRAARLKVTLDRKLGRETSPQVKLLAGLTLPPLARQVHRSGDSRADAAGPAASPQQRKSHRLLTPLPEPIAGVVAERVGSGSPNWSQGVRCPSSASGRRCVPPLR